MTTFIVMAIYILGVYIAFFQLQKWADHEVKEHDEYQVLFMLSLLSWLIYPLYWIVSIFKNCGEE